jgi:hypothetical protein
MRKIVDLKKPNWKKIKFSARIISNSDSKSENQTGIVAMDTTTCPLDIVYPTQI